MQWSSGQPTESAPSADISEITVGRYVLNSIVGLVRNPSASLSWLTVGVYWLLRQLLKFKHHQGLCCRSLLYQKVQSQWRRL